jgi:isoleucyl-tRNA synthetase
MSKSAGNVIEPKSVIDQNGAEVLRLWVAMLNYKEDAPFGGEILQRLVEAYRKIRNTWRFLLGNLSDFDPDKDSVPIAELEPLDRWALAKNAEIGSRILKAYDEYEYHQVFHAVYQYFTVDLSAFYLDVLKDRLYCSAETSRLRRSAQTALFRILADSLRLMAPILPFTTEEAWDALPAFREKDASVHLAIFPAYGDPVLSAEESQDWNHLLALRDQVLKELEKARERKLIGNALEARVKLGLPASLAGVADRYRDMLRALFIVSDVAVEITSGPETTVEVEPAAGGKCRRCWNYSTHLGASASHPDLCDRCEDVVGGAGR